MKGQNMEIKFNLQMFADDADTPTTDVETKDVPTNETVEENDTPKFDDADDDSKVEDEKEENKAEDEGEDKTKKNTNKANAERRLAEKQRKEQERKNKELERNAYLKGIKMALGDKNPYTDKPIVDDEDLEEYEIMKKLADEGKDPVEDYAEYIKQQKRLAKKEELAKQEQQEKIEKFVSEGINAVDSKYGKGTAEKYLKDETFNKYFGSALNNGTPLLEAVENYMDIEKRIADKSTEKAIEKDARRKASPGGFNSDSGTPKKSVSDMSKEEFDKYLKDLIDSSY